MSNIIERRKNRYKPPVPKSNYTSEKRKALGHCTISLCDLVKKYGTKSVFGVLHIGAHEAQEAWQYEEMGLNIPSSVAWIEGNPIIVERMKKRCPSYNYIQGVMSDVDDDFILFHVTNNEQSSSLLELGTHKEVHPTVRYVHDLMMRTSTIKTFNENGTIDITKYNFLNVDVQGAELLVLKGFGELLGNFDYLNLEINKNELYKGCALVGEIDEYVKKFGFVPRHQDWARNTGWGDGFYSRVRN